MKHFGTPKNSHMDPDVTLSDAGTIEREARGFRVLATKKIPAPIRSNLAVWSPLLDLLATCTITSYVMLYRMNGQRVWGLQHKFGAENPVEILQWRADGKFLAFGYKDGTTRIFDVSNGKGIHILNSESTTFSRITCIGWADNHSHRNPLRRVPPKSAECTADALADLDIGSMLPKLSVLPSSSGPDSTFTSKTTLEALINAVAKFGEGKNLDILLIGDESGKVLINIFDSFLVGTIELSSLSNHLKPGSRLLRHRASNDLSTHSLLISEPKTDRILFTTMDILFIQTFGQYLFQLASTSTRVQALIRYMSETAKSMEAEFRAMSDLVKKYISLIDEEIQKRNDEDSTVGLEFFEYLVTGLPTTELKEWFVDILAERGQKRWEKSSTTGYEALRRLAHENMLPTCERLAVLLSRLRGLARWKESGSSLGLEPEDFTRCLDVVTAVTLHSHEFLIKINREYDLFKAFNIWIKSSLDQLLTVDNANDKPDEEPSIDTLKVADYVGTHLTSSSLESFFTRTGKYKLSEYKERGESISELYSKSDVSAIAPGFAELAEYLSTLSKTVFAKPQQAMRQQLRVGKPIVIHSHGLIHTDIKVSAKRDETAVTYMALHTGSPDENSLVVAGIKIETEGGLSAVSKVTCANVSLPSPSHELVDLKIVDDSLLILIVHDRETSTSEMMTVEYFSLNFNDRFDPSTHTQGVYIFAHSLPPQTMKIVSSRKFDNTWVPAQVMINGNLHRRVGCVFADDKIRCFNFDIDHDEEDDDEEYAEEDSEGMDEDDEGEATDYFSESMEVEA